MGMKIPKKLDVDTQLDTRCETTVSPITDVIVATQDSIRDGDYSGALSIIDTANDIFSNEDRVCLLYTSPSPRDRG